MAFIPPDQPKKETNKEMNKGNGKKEKLVITNDTRRLWLKLRKAWNMELNVFSHTVMSLNDSDTKTVYDLVKRALFKDSYAEIVHEYPEMREFLRTDDDRMCMIDIYELVSWKLNQSEPLPPEKRLLQGMKGKIGRES